MAIPSFENEKQLLPRIQVLEVRSRAGINKEPIAWLIVERHEEYIKFPNDDTTMSAFIKLHYKVITAKNSSQTGGGGHFEGGYSKSLNMVSITSTSIGGGAVFLNLPGLEGQRIGTYLMNEIVIWVRQWPDAIVNSVVLNSGQADAANKDRRNRFWEQFGLKFDYSDIEHKGGRSQPMEAKELMPTDKWKENITERRMFDYLADVLYAEQHAKAELSQKQNFLDRRNAEFQKAKNNPIRWALMTLLVQYMFSIVMVTLAIVFVGLVWIRYRAG